MVWTREQQTAAFARAKAEFLEIDDDDDPLAIALADLGISKFRDFFTISLSSVDNMHYRAAVPVGETPSPREVVPLARRNVLKYFIKFIKSLDPLEENTALSSQEWDLVYPDEFETYCMMPTLPPDTVMTAQANPASPRTGAGIDVQPPPDVVPPPRPPPDPLLDWRRGTKRDISVYPTLRDMQHWDSWSRSVIAFAHLHNVSEVFNPDYMAFSPQEDALLREKNYFVYAMFNKCILTDIGQTIVREHDTDMDAQRVYAKMLILAASSTSADLAKTKIIKYLTTSTLDSRWRGDTQSFLLTWREQMRKLHNILPTDEHYPEAVKKRMLITSVDGIPELANIQAIDNIEFAKNRTHLNYDQYFDLLLSAAATRDDKMKINPEQKNRRNMVQFHELQDSGYYEDPFAECGLDSYEYGPNDTLEYSVNQAQQRRQQNPNPFIPADKWLQLDDTARKILRPDYQPRTDVKPASSIPPPRPHAGPSLSANEHDVTHGNLGNEQEVFDDAVQNANELYPDEEEGNDDSNELLAYATNRSIQPPSTHLRALLASSSRRPPP